jgi:hypothetical protein
MLKRQKNLLLEIVREEGHDPNYFTSGRDESIPDESFVVRLKNSPVSFKAYPSANDYERYNICFTLLAPGFPESQIYPDNGFLMTFDEVVLSFRSWLTTAVSGYREEVQLPDLWAEVGASVSLIDAYRDQEGDGQFSEAEKMSIPRDLAGFRTRLIEEFSPSDSQLALIDQRLHYLEAALDRLNIFDWRGVAISTLLAIGIALSLDTSKGRLLFEMFRNALSSIHLLD